MAETEGSVVLNIYIFSLYGKKSAFGPVKNFYSFLKDVIQITPVYVSKMASWYRS